MLKPAEFLQGLQIHESYQSRLIDWLRPWRLRTHANILIVVDTEISISPTSNFGISTVIDLIRNTRVGCMKFRIDIAVRDGAAQSIVANPGPTQAKYNGFRFDMASGGNDVINKYEQIWCFGFKPSNSGSSNDAEIDQPSAFPASNNELEKLDEWMRVRKGGLFGTGDHHFLGASMCRKIPRLGTMRRWTNADNVPPQGRTGQPNAADRIDTLRPPSPSYELGAPGGPLPLTNSPHQGDLTVQPIQWVTWRSHPLFFRTIRPHPVLCHPTLGPIDVMPDHAHEGLCVVSPNLGAPNQFNGNPEYPAATGGGAKPAPQIIAYGSNLSQPPYNFDKGPQPARTNNPMIAIYDGHLAGVGRVATDSTWHHWMDVNIDNLKTANNDDWKKISRYFINLAVWLNPPEFSTHCLYLATVISHIQYPGFQEYYRKAPTLELGRALRQHLSLYYGPCWVTERIWAVMSELELIPQKKFPDWITAFDKLEIDPQRFEDLVLGRMVEATLKQAEQLKNEAPDCKDQKLDPLRPPEKLFAKPVAEALEAFVEEMRGKSKSEKDIISALKI